MKILTVVGKQPSSTLDLGTVPQRNGTQAIVPENQFEARTTRVGPELQPQLTTTPLTPEQRRALETQLSRIDSLTEDIEKALKLADSGHPAFGAIRDSLEGLTSKLAYEKKRIETALRYGETLPGGDPAKLTPFIEEDLSRALDRLGQLDWPIAFPGMDDHGVAEDLALSLRLVLGRE